MTITKSSAARTAASPLRRLIAPALAALFVFGLLLGTPHAHADQWYFKKTDDHTQPPLDSAQERIASCNGYYVNQKATDEKVIYLTFDAGYENGCTAQILDALKKHNVSATFFLVGNYLEKNPDLVRRMVAEGHTVGNHTMHHYDMSRISDPAAFQKELEDLEQLYEQTVGEPMQKYYRPPQGIYSEENLRQAKNLGYKTVFWSLAYVDWKNDDQPTAQAAFNKLLPRIHPGAVVLLHSTSKTNAAILDELLTRWEDMGYRFAPIQELFPPASQP